MAKPREKNSYHEQGNENGCLHRQHSKSMTCSFYQNEGCDVELQVIFFTE